MARLHHLLSRALASHPLLPLPPPTLLPAIPRPPPPRFPAMSARVLLPVFSSSPSPRSRMQLLAAASRQFGASSARRRRRSPAPARRRAPPPPPLARRRRKGPVELSVQIGIEEELPDDPLILSIAETLRTDVGKAMKVGLDILRSSDYRTRDTSIRDIDKYDNIEVSLLLCNDYFIRKLNKEWRDQDHATDVLSMSQHIPGLDIPILLLGDIVISVETAARQAEERGHELIDEIRILTVHGLLHLLGFDHELSSEAEEEMEKEEEHILKILEWKGKGLIKSAYDVASNEDHSEICVEGNQDTRSPLEARQQKLIHIVCDIDDIHLEDKSQLQPKIAKALRAAISREVEVIVATGKSRTATIRTFKLLNFEGKGDVMSELSPGVFLQGSLVYGRNGQEIHRANLDLDICREAFLYSLKHKVPLIACSEDQCLTLFEHPFVDFLHTTYHENKAKVVPSIEELLAYSSIQKLLFLGNAEGASSVLRKHWSELAEGQAHVMQTRPDTIEIVPFGTSKSHGIKMLLNHLGITEEDNEGAWKEVRRGYA